MLMTALAVTLLASGPLHLSNECWFVSFLGPEDREQIVKNAADEKFEKPSAAALKIARRAGIDVLVFTEAAMNCAGDPDQLLSTNGLLHLVAESGRVGQWQVGAEE